MVDVRSNSVSIPSEIFYDPGFPIGKEIGDTILLDRLKIADDFSNLPKIAEFIAERFDLRKANVEIAIKTLLDQFSKIDSHTKMDQVPGDDESGKAPPSRQFNSILITKAEKSATFRMVEKNHLPRTDKLQEHLFEKGVVFPRPALATFRTMEQDTNNSHLSSIWVVSPDASYAEEQKPEFYVDSQFVDFAKPLPTLDKAKLLFNDIMSESSALVTSDQSRNSVGDAAEVPLIDLFITDKPIMIARNLIDLADAYDKLSSDDQSALIELLEKGFQSSHSGEDGKDSHASMIKFLTQSSHLKNEHVAQLKHLVRTNTATYPLVSYGLNKTVTMVKTEEQGLVEKEIDFFGSSEEHARQLSWIMSQSIGGEFGRVAMSAIIQSLRNLLGDADHTLMAEEADDLMRMLVRYETCFLDGNTMRTYYFSNEVENHENDSGVEDGKVPKESLEELVKAEKKLVDALSDNSGTQHLFQIGTNNHALLLEISHEEDGYGQAKSYLSVFDSRGHDRLDPDDAYLTPEERGKSLQEKKIDITALIRHCRDQENETDLIDIADNILSLVDTIKFTKDENGKTFVSRRDLGYFEKLYISDTFNSKITREIKTIMPYDLREQCPVVLDESTILRRPQRIGDCQTDVILSHFSHRAELNSSYLKFKSHFLKEAKTNITNQSAEVIRSHLKGLVENDLSPRSTSPGSAFSDKNESTIGKMFVKIKEDLQKIKWMTTGSTDSELQQRYLREFSQIKDNFMEAFNKLPDEAMEEFRSSAIANIDARIDKNETRISAHKEKTRLYTDDDKARVIFHGRQYDDRKSNTFVHRDYIEFLTREAVPGAKFGDVEIARDVSDGCCTAMSLTFAKQFKEIKRSLKEEGVGESQERTGKALDQIKEDVKFKLTTSKTVAAQALFNTIELTGEQGVDPGQAKMDLMARVFGMRVTESSMEIDLNHSSAMKDLGDILDDYDNGTYALRMINDDEIKLKEGVRSVKKGENYGHTTILVKNEGHYYLYNPNGGSRELDRDNLLKAIKSMHGDHSIPKTRFHQLKVLDDNSRTESLSPKERLQPAYDTILDKLSQLSNSSPVEERRTTISEAMKFTKRVYLTNKMISSDNSHKGIMPKFDPINPRPLETIIDTAIDDLISDLSSDVEKLRAHREVKQDPFQYLINNNYSRSKTVSGGYYSFGRDKKMELIEKMEQFSETEASAFLTFIDDMMTQYRSRGGDDSRVDIDQLQRLMPRREEILQCCQLVFPGLGYEHTSNISDTLDLIEKIEDLPAAMAAIKENPDLIHPKYDPSNIFSYQQFRPSIFSKWLTENKLIRA